MPFPFPEGDGPAPRDPTGTDSTTSQSLLARIRQQGLPLFCPTSLLVEVAAAVARVLDGAELETD